MVLRVDPWSWESQAPSIFLRSWSFILQVTSGFSMAARILPLLTSLTYEDKEGSQYILICQLLLWADFPRNPTQQLPPKFHQPEFSPMATPSCKRLAKVVFQLGSLQPSGMPSHFIKRKLRLQESGTLPKISPTVGQSQHLDGGLPSSNARVLCLLMLPIEFV